MSEAPEERAKRLIRKWHSFGNELDLPLETNTLAREIRSAEAAAREEGKKTSERIRNSLQELVTAMDRYEDDVCEPPPHEHREMMNRARRALAGEEGEG